MFQLRRRGQVVFEDLLREMETIERQMLSENSALAMNLMVLEAKLRERFQAMDKKIQEKMPFLEDDLLGDDLSMEDVHALIPKELPMLPSLEQVSPRRRGKRTIETVGMAALFALVTALGVFGLASMLQLALAWIA